jgi:hypothetical protein
MSVNEILNSAYNIANEHGFGPEFREWYVAYRAKFSIARSAEYALRELGLAE